jgi:D-alanine-D-alanine ligase
MSSASSFLPIVPLENLKVWVLAPHLVTNDANIDYYYDFSQSIEEYTQTFAALGIEWKWQPVTMDTYADVINDIVKEKKQGIYFPVVFNICDGDEINGTPGISVVKLLEKKKLVYTGSDEYFYKITTSKIPMKKAFDKYHVPNAKWEAIKLKDQYTNGIFGRLGIPIIVKPSVSGGSMGVGVKNVVENKAELNEQIGKMFDGYRGWNLAADGLIAESFITGPEYTVLIVGSYDKPAEAKVYTPVERIFHPSLPDKEKFLSFDRLWEIYEEETPMPNEGNFYEYE